MDIVLQDPHPPGHRRAKHAVRVEFALGEGVLGIEVPQVVDVVPGDEDV